MKTGSLSEAAAMLSWPVLMLVSSVFCLSALAALVVGMWSAAVIAGCGAAVFGRGLWLKRKGRQALETPEEKQASLLTPRLALGILVAGFAGPAYFFAAMPWPVQWPEGEALALLLLTAALMWVLGVTVVGVALFFIRLLGIHFKRGFDKGRQR